MPQDQYTQFYGEICMRCNKEERVHNKKWCQTCIDAPRVARAKYVADEAAFAMQYHPPTSPPPVPAKELSCRRCGSVTWTRWADGRCACAHCGAET